MVRLWAERRKEQLGVRFKTKMVVGAMALSLLPVLLSWIQWKACAMSRAECRGCRPVLPLKFRMH